jgi:hypothetical protein
MAVSGVGSLVGTGIGAGSVAGSDCFGFGKG